MTEQIQLSDKMRKLGKIFCAWNDLDFHSEMNGDNAMHEVGKLFNKETLTIWREYTNLHTDVARREFLKEVLKVKQ